MNIFQKLKLSLKLDEQTELFNAYYLRIKYYYDKNFLLSTFVCHLEDNEIKSLGFKRPFGYKELNVCGNPKNYFKRKEEEYLQNKIKYAHLESFYNRLNDRYIQKLKKEGNYETYMEFNSIRSETIEEAKTWALEVGSKSVLIFKIGTSELYSQMINEIPKIIFEFEWMYKQVNGDLTLEWREKILYLRNKIREFKESDYVIERT